MDGDFAPLHLTAPGHLAAVSPENRGMGLTAHFIGDPRRVALSVTSNERMTLVCNRG